MDDVRWHHDSGTGPLDPGPGSAGARYRAKLAQYPERRAQSSVMRLAREIVRALVGPRASTPALGGREERARLEPRGPNGDARGAAPLSGSRAERN